MICQLNMFMRKITFDYLVNRCEKINLVNEAALLKDVLEQEGYDDKTKEDLNRIKKGIKGVRDIIKKLTGKEESGFLAGRVGLFLMAVIRAIHDSDESGKQKNAKRKLEAIYPPKQSGGNTKEIPLAYKDLSRHFEDFVKLNGEYDNEATYITVPTTKGNPRGLMSKNFQTFVEILANKANISDIEFKESRKVFAEMLDTVADLIYGVSEDDVVTVLQHFEGRKGRDSETQDGSRLHGGGGYAKKSQTEQIKDIKSRMEPLNVKYPKKRGHTVWRDMTFMISNLLKNKDDKSTIKKSLYNNVNKINMLKLFGFNMGEESSDLDDGVVKYVFTTDELWDDDYSVGYDIKSLSDILSNPTPQDVEFLGNFRFDEPMNAYFTLSILMHGLKSASNPKTLNKIPNVLKKGVKDIYKNVQKQDLKSQHDFETQVIPMLDEYIKNANKSFDDLKKAGYKVGNSNSIDKNDLDPFIKGASAAAIKQFYNISYEMNKDYEDGDISSSVDLSEDDINWLRSGKFGKKYPEIVENEESIYEFASAYREQRRIVHDINQAKSMSSVEKAYNLQSYKETKTSDFVQHLKSLDFDKDDIEEAITKFNNDLDNATSFKKVDNVFRKFMTDPDYNDQEDDVIRDTDYINDIINAEVAWLNEDIKAIPRQFVFADESLSRDAGNEMSLAGLASSHAMGGESGDYANLYKELRDGGYLKTNVIYTPKGAFSIFNNGSSKLKLHPAWKDSYEYAFNMDSAAYASNFAQNLEDLFGDTKEIENVVDVNERLLFTKLSRLIDDLVYSDKVKDILSAGYSDNLEAVKNSITKVVEKVKLLKQLNDRNAIIAGENGDREITKSDVEKIIGKSMKETNPNRGFTPHVPNDGASDTMVAAKRSSVNESDQIFDTYMGGFANRIGKNKPTLISENYNKKKYKNYNQWINECM